MHRILIIEDEVEVTQVLQDYFSKHGLEVLVETDGEKGLATIIEKKPELVILDMRLGEGLSGMEVLRRAKAAKATADFVIVTAIDDDNIVKMARGLGAFDYVTKPVSTRELERVIKLRLKI